MPYIRKKYRPLYDGEIKTLSATLQNNDYPKGHMTYIVYKLVVVWFMHTPGYEAIESIRGMLAGVLSEFDRKYAFRYEDKKIRKNGDVDATFEYNVGSNHPEDCGVVNCDVHTNPKAIQQGKLQYHVCACCVDELRGD